MLLGRPVVLTTRSAMKAPSIVKCQFSATSLGRWSADKPKATRWCILVRRRLGQIYIGLPVSKRCWKLFVGMDNNVEINRNQRGFISRILGGFTFQSADKKTLQKSTYLPEESVPLVTSQGVGLTELALIGASVFLSPAPRLMSPDCSRAPP